MDCEQSYLHPPARMGRVRTVVQSDTTDARGGQGGPWHMEKDEVRCARAQKDAPKGLWSLPIGC